MYHPITPRNKLHKNYTSNEIFLSKLKGFYLKGFSLFYLLLDQH